MEKSDPGIKTRLKIQVFPFAIHLISHLAHKDTPSTQEYDT